MTYEISSGDTKQTGLWTMTKKLVPDFKGNNTDSIMPSPKTQQKFNLDENSSKYGTDNSEEYKKLKQQLESAPDSSFRESFMSYASSQYKRKSTIEDRSSIYETGTRASLNSDYGEVLTTFESNEELYGDDKSDHRASRMTIDTVIEEPSTISYLKSAIYGNHRKSIDAKKTTDTDSMPSTIMPANPSSNPSSKRQSRKSSHRKSILPSRMSTVSIMSTDSLL